MKIVDGEIYIQRGTTGEFIVDIEQADGEPYTRTSGDKIIFEVKKRPDHELEALISKELTGLSFVLDPEDTANIPTGDYVYEIKLTTAASAVYKTEFNEFHVTATVTE